MMLLRVWALLMLIALPAHAETAKVTSGEHADFSRLVVALPQATDWTLGRTADGYELALAGALLQFDVSTVFDLIPKNRLTGIFGDPGSGNLHLTLDCDCHALPFNLNDRTIVIDLRDGVAPEGSSFETALDGSALPRLQGKPKAALRPRQRAPGVAEMPQEFDWMKVEAPPVRPSVAFLISTSSGSESALRETLVAQLADGAARNVISLALPQEQTAPADAPRMPDAVPIRLTNSLGLQISTAPGQTPPLQADGQECLPEDELRVETWKPEDAETAVYSGLFIDLVGEFDKPQQDAVLVAAQRYIYLGFGAEARAVLQAFAPENKKTAMLSAMSYLVDGEPILSGNVFAGMQGCDTAAAFWALLAADTVATEPLSKTAIKRTYSALPPHLRTHFGPQLLRTLESRGEDALATEIALTLDRMGGEDTRAMDLATSQILVAEGHAEAALVQVEDVMADPGQLQAQGLISLVDAKIAAQAPISADVAATIAAMLDEYDGHPLHAELLRAYGMALAGSGQFATAREMAETGTPLTAAFWTLLSQNADDDTLLVQALQPPSASENIPAAAGAKIAERLLQLGFADEAALWHGLFPLPDALMSEATFSAGTRSEVPDAPAAMLFADQPAANGSPLTAASDTNGVPDVLLESRVARWTEDWAAVAATEDGTWSQLASGVATDEPIAAVASLTAAAKSLSQSQESRALISSLLAETEEIRPAP